MEKIRFNQEKKALSAITNYAKEKANKKLKKMKSIDELFEK